MERQHPIILDSRLRLMPGLPRPLVEEIRQAFTHDNPDYEEAKRLGYRTFDIPREEETWREESNPEGGAPLLTLPRGGTKRVRELLAKYSLEPRFIDKRVVKDAVAWPDFVKIKDLHWFQKEGRDVCVQKHQGIIRAPTGAGKSIMAMAVARELRQPALFIMRNGNLLKQWQEELQEQLGLRKSEIGVFKGGRKLRVGERVTLALQQTLNSEAFPWADVADAFGAVFVDEVQDVAAKTYMSSVDKFPARYRFGFSADETRKDEKEYLTYDLFGEVLYEVPRHVLEEQGIILPVKVRLIPTEFRADWYRNASGGDKDFGQLLEQMMGDVQREALLVRVVKRLVDKEETPLFVFTQRTEHALKLSDVKLYSAKVKCGLMIGGDDNATRFDEDRKRLNTGEISLCVGTYQAIGVGINFPKVRAGVMALPIGSNKQFFNQVRGRVCRSAEGKDEAVLYALWDQHVFPRMPRMMASWNKGAPTEVLGEGGRWEAV